MMILSSLYQINMMNGILIILTHSSGVDMSFSSDTLSWFRANKSLFLLLRAACISEKQKIPIWYHGGCLIRSGNMSTHRERLGSPPVLGGVRVVRRFRSVLCYVLVFCLYIVLCLVYPMLLVSLDCPFLIAPSVFSNVYSCFQCLWIVLCRVYPMLPVYLDCSFLITPSVFSNVYWFVYFRPLSCVPNVVSVSRLFILDNTFRFL